MDIYLICNRKTIRLPVLPSSFSIETKQNNQSVNIVHIGDINLIGNRGLKSLAFSSFFPLHEGKHGYQRHGKHREAYELTNTIEKWKDDGKVVRVLITGTNINSEYLIDDFSYGVEDGSGDVEYSITFSEYVRPKVNVRNGKKSALYSNTRSTKEAPKTYTVKSGDTLKSIAKKQLGSSKKFVAIAEINKIAAPYKIKAGQVLLLN
jgi:hypothetical protein